MSNEQGKRYECSLRSTKISILVLSLVVVFFLTLYGRQICPFMSSLFFSELFGNLLIIMFFQLIVRHLLSRKFLLTGPGKFPPRSAYKISIATWILSGIACVALHSVRYGGGFPISSHLKLLAGYWGIGAGLLSLLEYTIFENDFRESHNQDEPIFIEKISQRFMLSISMAAFVPTFTLVMIVSYYVFIGLVTAKVRMEAFFLGIIMVFIAVAMGWFYGKHLREDLKNIQKGIDRIAKGDFSTKLDTTRLDELGQVSHCINHMAKGLSQREKIREAFGRFVSPEVADEFISKYIETGKEAKLGGKKKDLTILYCDLRNFTPLAETLDPEELANLLNQYFSLMVEPVRKNGGIVDKFIGDALMAVFGLVESSGSAPTSAVAAAIDMRKKLTEFNEILISKGLNPLNNGIGIHRGEVVAGYMGSNDRLEFTVIGKNVNLAARLESKAKAPFPPILFTREVADSIASVYGTRLISTEPLKGVAKPVELFSLEPENLN